MPLLININQEGGRLNTLRFSELTIFPGNMSIGVCRDEKLAYKIGKAIGQELKMLGITWNLYQS